MAPMEIRAPEYVANAKNQRMTQRNKVLTYGLEFTAAEEATYMDRGARVKFKTGSKAQANWRVTDGMAGMVLARYRPTHPGQPERLDVTFGGNVTVWGERASEFEIVPAEKLQ